MSINRTPAKSAGGGFRNDDSNHYNTSEERPLLHGAHDESITESSASAGDEHTRLRYKSLKAVLLTNFLSATGFSLLMSTMWPYLWEMTGRDDSYKALLGYVVGGFSVGQLVGGPFFGWYSTQRPYAETFYITIVVRLIGNLLYAVTGHLPISAHNRFLVLVASRVLVGLGAGSMAVCNAYITGATTVKERATWIGLYAGSGGLGFIIGPLIASAMSGLHEYSGTIGGFTLTLNFMTAPPYMAALFCILNIVLLMCTFKDTSLVQRRGNDSEDDDGPSIDQRDYVAVAVLLFIYFGIMFVLSAGESIGIPLVMDEFGWSPSKADLYSGIIAGVGGIQTVFVFTQAKNYSARLGERKVLCIGMVLLIVAQLAMVPYIGKRIEQNRSCADPWCRSDPALPLWQYLVSIFIVNIGFPLASVMIFTLYSYVLGPFHTGSWMGIINGFGSLARCIGPALITSGYTWGGPRLIASAQAILSATVLSIFAIFGHRLVPFGTSTTGSSAYQRI
eukprot:m.144015 g.144015  ORF g.144015 m.144015 type:complete len:505 (+) comp11593_c0_seq36:131-1645(+)